MLEEGEGTDQDSRYSAKRLRDPTVVSVAVL